MTRGDVAEYLRKIYDVPVRDVRILVKQGKIEKDRVFRKIAQKKEEDTKFALVTLVS